MATPNTQLTLPPYNASNWNSPLNENFTTIDAVFGNTVNIAVSSGDKLLTIPDLLNMRINLSGAIGGSTVYVIFPDGVGGSWVITNNTIASGGKIFLRSQAYTVAPLELPASGSVFVYSDGKNIYSAVSGTAGNYLPLSGGTIDGTLGVNKDLTVGGKVSVTGDAEFKGTTKFKDVFITGSINLTVASIGVDKFTVGGAILSGSQVFGVLGESEYNGLMRVESGDIDVILGGITVRNNAAVNSFGGSTTIPTGASLTIKKNATFTVEDGAQLNLAGVFSPTSISTGDIKSSTGVTVTGSGGVTTGSGGLKCSGPADVSGAAKFASTVEITGKLTLKAASDLGSSPTMVDPVITSAGNASLYMNPNGGYRTVVRATSDAKIGFYNADSTGIYANLNISTGKWTASGGVGIGVNGAVAQAIASHVPASVYPTDCGSAIDVEDVLIYLLEELMSAKSELAALKAR